MENFEQRWKQVEHFLEDRFGKVPDMEGMLFLVGINELGVLPSRKFSKEQKQDLMHVAVCALLSIDGYYRYEGRDKDGWPHFKEVQPVPKMELTEQERFLQEHIIAYFDLEEE